MASSGKGISETVEPSFTDLAVTYCNIENLHIDDKNPRRHSKRQTQQIATSIKAFGFNVPFLVDRDLRLIAATPSYRPAKS